MRIMKVKRVIIPFLVIGVMTLVSGCVRYPDGNNGNGETNYQLEITVEVEEQINTDEGIYYIVMDVDENPATGPFSDISSWEDRFYYIKLESNSFYFAQKEEDSPELYLTDDSISENKIQVTIALSDLEDPNSIDINVITTDSEGNNYDHLDSYFTIYTILGSTEEGVVSEGGYEEGGPDFDIVSVKAKIKTPFE